MTLSSYPGLVASTSQGGQQHSPKCCHTVWGWGADTAAGRGLRGPASGGLGTGRERAPLPLLPLFAWSVLAHLADPPTPNEKNLLIHAVIVLLSFNLIRTAVSHFVHIIICLMSLFPPLDFFFFLLLGHGLAEACGIFSLQHKGSLVAPRGI